MLNNLVLGTKRGLAKAIRGNIQDNHVIDAYHHVVLHALNRFLPQHEVHEIVHGYRRSVFNEDSLNADIQKLNSEEHSVPKDEHYWNAIRKVQQIFTPEIKLQPIHFADLRHYPWKLSTSIGAPFATSKEWNTYVVDKFHGYENGFDESTFLKHYHRDLFAEAHSGISLDPPMIDARMSKRNLYNEMFFINRKHIHLIKDGRKTNDAGHDLRYWHTAFARQHLVKQDDPDKVRLVFGAPSTSLMAELMFIWPIQAWLLSLKERSPMLWPFVTLTGGWHRLVNCFQKFCPSFGLVATVDWRGFDRYARHTVIRDIHSNIVRPMFDFSKGYHPTRDYPETHDTSPDRLENLWNWMCDSVLTTPLMLPDGTLIRFQHSGIFSGYFQTQLLDSLYNLVMLFTILSRMGFNLDNVYAKVQGDDSIICIICSFLMVSHWFISMLRHYADYYFGAVVNDKKTEVSDSLEHVEVLRYRNRGGIPYRERTELLAQLYHPERAITYQALMARTIGIAYANCGSDPLVYQICEDIHQYLSNLGVKPDPAGLPSGVRFVQDYLPGQTSIDVQRFPSYFETVSRLLDGYDEQPSEGYWPRSHFIGIPGRT
ncbi:RNA dependent RNA polymerase [Setosphaeria turcica partitivirus 1]|uniref:RNA-dependent RNA polymerase n=1 Tax=Exserohilum turcicum partitivirus 1 TaxID=3229043 RepID=A0AAU7YBZ1_9VIRU|nr:RNA dependent RNA polymerase [Setosphaeria turcica partitivirus 1]